MKRDFLRDSAAKRGERRGLLPCFLFVFLIAQSVTAPVSAAIYKWTDADGNVHYGERLPPDQQTSEIPSAVSPPDADVVRSQDRLNRWLERQQRSDQLRRDDEEKAERDAVENAQRDALRKKHCDWSKRDLRVLKRQRPVFWTDENDERIYLDDETRAREVKRLEAEIKANCQ